ncbi:MAG: dihydropteroate synthase [Flavobacteriaceae bacterium]|nr:dihydropteroate synthase [Flavobacteriaceae bacterium]
MFSLNCNGRLVNLDQPKIMGILNVTPDSFFDGGQFENIELLVQQATKLIDKGADFLDIGGASSKPGAIPVPEKEELQRVLPAIQAVLDKHPDAIVSIDTTRSRVATEAVKAGAMLVNDISAGNSDSKMLEVVGDLGVPYIAMHMQGTPQNMQNNPQYKNVWIEIQHLLAQTIEKAYSKGIDDVIIDPGFGFGKTVYHNFELLKHLEEFRHLNTPILVGLSRKSMIQRVLGVSAQEALHGSSVLHTLALSKGAHILRVHDVKEAKEVVQLVNQVHNPEKRIDSKT